MSWLNKKLDDPLQTTASLFSEGRFCGALFHDLALSGGYKYHGICQATLDVNIKLMEVKFDSHHLQIQDGHLTRI